MPKPRPPVSLRLDVGLVAQWLVRRGALRRPDAGSVMVRVRAIRDAVVLLEHGTLPWNCVVLAAQTDGAAGPPS